MVLMPAAQGRHHSRRPGMHASGKSTPQPKMSRSDKRWFAGLSLYLTAMFALGQGLGGVGGAKWLMYALTGLLAASVLYRLTHHSGDRYRLMAVTPSETPAPVMEGRVLPVAAATEDAAPMPVYHPHVTRKVVKPGTGKMMMFSVAVGLWLLSELSRHRLDLAHQIQDDTERLLKIPGRWNGYQPTSPNMGTRGWGDGGFSEGPQGSYWWQ